MEILIEQNGVRRMIEEDMLEKTSGVIDNENERIEWTEWRLDGELVKRGAHVRLKKNVLASALAAAFN
jgi:hypothetical protein